ncbi:cobalt-precorrin-6A reductase [Spiractinospora alimapuensis]|uniref:cobalt-precorrin-6A reductase n=1 Tax=Spiractinospora alimapuensis TaxID=2820884 RepID=UPI001EE9EF91|nr:cobalt-precorrin-6A reductase [Spiractinospora alimapuensis]QVQ50546.1 cobalt-precorrin-6A reductase [Spiractinospora alimapuensis]
MTARVLVLGGTTEARRLSDLLTADPLVEVVTSLAGRTHDPRRPHGEVRVGGFGGVEGLTTWLRDNAITALVDATHPFAAQISRAAAEAGERGGVPVLALRRPGWSPVPGDAWHWVDSLEEAARALLGFGERVFLTVGRQSMAPFAAVPDRWFLARCVHAPEPPTPPRMELLIDRGPFTLDGERDLLARHQVDVVVTKDSGGEAAAPKLAAARELGVPVLIARRPPAPDVATTATPEGAADWIRQVHAG